MPDYSPAAFVQELRMSVRKNPTATFLVAEGGGDKVALTRHLDSSVRVKVAGGRETLVAAYLELEAHYRDRVVFVADCDGDTDQTLKGQVDLVISQNRDIQADHGLSLGALQPSLEVFLSPQYESQAQLRAVAENAAHAIRRVARVLTLLVVVAARHGLPTQVKVRGVGKRVLSAINLDAVVDWKSGTVPSVEAYAVEAGRLLAWSMDDVELVRTRIEALLVEACRRHSLSTCDDCLDCTYIGGHQLIAASESYIVRTLGSQLGENEVSNLLYACANGTLLDSWDVYRRLRVWSDASGFVIVA